MEHTGLVLEGGGMRGLYTAGVLDFFLEQELHFPYVIGVSMGACNAASYISRQRGRNKRIVIDHINNPRYISYRNLLMTRSLFGMDYIFNQVPNRLDPFDYPAFYAQRQRYVVGATDCDTGQPVYFENCAEILTALQASSSLPFIAKIVDLEGRKLLDGGISDPIPVKKAMLDGNTKNVIILTRNAGYRKQPFRAKWLGKLFYAKYPKLVDMLMNRHRVYNETLAHIEKLQAEGSVFVICPRRPIQVERIEKDQQKLAELYTQGYEDAKQSWGELQAWLRLNP
ncbi:MAG TPA: patatin family protein [Verrucomicrobiae bacterium]|nr:patatin family protein [Verrucomicrobiae bacterium]